MATRRRSSAAPPEPDLSQLSEEERATWQMPVSVAQRPEPLSAAFEDGEPVEETAVDRVAAILGAFTADDRAHVKLYRVLGPNKLGWCKDYSVSEFEQGGFEMIRNDWGPGEYSVRVMGSSGAHGGISLRRVANVTIQGSAAPSAAQQAATADTGLARAIESMMQSQQQFQQNLLQALTNRPDPMAQMRDTVGLMTMMREAMGINIQASQKSSIREIVDAIQELKGVADMVSPKEPDPDNLLSMVPGIMDLVKTGMQQRAQNPAPALPGPGALSLAPPEPVADPAAQPGMGTPTAPTDLENPMIAMIQKSLAPLYTMAVVGMPAATGADYLASVADGLDDEQFAMLDGILSDDKWFDALCAVLPDFKPHEAWARQVRDAYIAISQGDEGDGEGEPPAAAASDAAKGAPQ